ncbi:uncharacterized protein [Ptychodera flava]|uniref:uncharacterized protein n=1 Tax=Ptychodera flava TaxID=63121 RepID=UPI00396A84D7
MAADFQFTLVFFLSAVYVSESASVLQNYYQIPLPRRPLGYVYDNGASTAPVQIDLFVCLLCPDNNSSLSTALEVADHYGPRLVRLTLHGYPVPYLKGSFLAAQATRAVNELDRSKTVQYMQEVLNNQDQIKGSGENVSDAEITEILIGQATKLGISRGDFLGKFEDSATNQLCRYELQMANSRGIYAAPWFFVNGITVIDFKPIWTIHDWTAILDPLLTDYEEPDPENPLPTCLPGEPGCDLEPDRPVPCSGSTLSCSVGLVAISLLWTLRQRDEEL